MTKQQAKNILGDRARWELVAMKRALEMIPFFNTDEEEERLEAVNVLLNKKPFDYAKADCELPLTKNEMDGVAQELEGMFGTLSNGEKIIN